MKSASYWVWSIGAVVAVGSIGAARTKLSEPVESSTEKFVQPRHGPVAVPTFLRSAEPLEEHTVRELLSQTPDLAKDWGPEQGLICSRVGATEEGDVVASYWFRDADAAKKWYRVRVDEPIGQRLPASARPKASALATLDHIQGSVMVQVTLTPRIFAMGVKDAPVAALQVGVFRALDGPPSTLPRPRMEPQLAYQ